MTSGNLIKTLETKKEERENDNTKKLSSSSK